MVAALWLAAMSPRAYALAAVMAALLSVGNAASSSRTGLMQLALILLLTLWWQRRSAGRPTDQARAVHVVVLAALAAYAVALFALPLLTGLDPLASGAWARLRAGDAVCFSRLTLWGNVLHLIAQKPWTGWGWGVCWVRPERAGGWQSYPPPPVLRPVHRLGLG